MNPQNTDFRLPQVKAHPWHKVRSISASCPHPVKSKLHLMFFILSQVFQKHMPPEAVDLVSRLLQYSPSFRPTAVSLFKLILLHGAIGVYILYSYMTLY